MKTKRIIALDAFRGFTVALMILVNNPGTWTYIYSPLRHAEWQGCTPTDLVFPFFLFVVGVASFFSFKKFDFKLNKTTFLKLLKRTLLIFLIGFLLNLYPFFDINKPFSLQNILNKLETVRILGVLQRIACAYFIGIFLCLLFKSTKKIAAAGIALMLLFWGILIACNPNNPYDKKENACRAVDLIIPCENHIYKGYSRALELDDFNFTIVDDTHFAVKPAANKNIDINYISFKSSSNDYELNKEIQNDAILYTVIPSQNTNTENASANAVQQLSKANERIPFDPEGLLGALSAAATVIFGFLTGRLINFYSENKEKMVTHLLLCGLAAVFVGMFWGQWFIICKPLWTGSYVLYAGGLAMIVLAFFIWFMDVKKYSQKYFRPLVAFGSNPLFLFVMSGVIVKTMGFPYFNIDGMPLQSWIYVNVYKNIIDPAFGSLLYAITFVAALWILAEFLYRKKIYIKV
ncbi:MAG: heparan-alpha-glucosaminide N-acetyltransferase domain-containing protein [Prevotellaceae bacterium]|jgi:predicted acyltransferase|nr:heparan-alpha-glucosaminide N-acetyltransferase domain-containing protein [Prevotellaceae bacterium]